MNTTSDKSWWQRNRVAVLVVFLVVGGMAVHNALVWVRKAAARKRQTRNIVRLTVNQRVQHWLLLTSFITLVLSGFALQYPDSWLASLLGGSEYLRRIVHRDPVNRKQRPQSPPAMD